MGKLTTIPRPRSWIWEEGKGREKRREEEEEKGGRNVRRVKGVGRKGRPYNDFCSVGDYDKRECRQRRREFKRLGRAGICNLPIF